MTAEPTTSPNFEGNTPRTCGEHRTVGPHRAWCLDCRERCYPADLCAGCCSGRYGPGDPGWLDAAARETLVALGWTPPTEVVHLCPPDGSGVMPCCGRTPFERQADRMTADPAAVTCGGAK